MNAQPATLLPLPAALHSPRPYRQARRRPAGTLAMRGKPLARFNRLLARLQRIPQDRAQLASAWHELMDRPSSDGCAAAIAQRLPLAEAVERMIRDAAWQLADEAMATARVVVGHAHGRQARGTRIGRVDDAILIDAAWPRLGAEVDSYLDYCRLRAIEAELRGCEVGAFSFTREDWQQARRAEAGLRAHVRRVGRSSYLPPAATALFRVC